MTTCLKERGIEMNAEDEVLIHNKPTSLQWLINNVLQWFGPFHTVVDTGTPCHETGCNGRLVHVYQTVEIEGKPYKTVFTKTNRKGGRRVATQVHDSCTVPSCPMWGEWTLVQLEKNEQHAKAYRAQRAQWLAWGRRK